MSEDIRIFKKKWNYDRMMLWLMPIKHIGANCGELAISYLGLVPNEVCIKDTYENLMRGNYGRLTSEISRFINENNAKYNVNFDNTHNLNADEFLNNDSKLAKIIGKNRETMVLIRSHRYRIGHYVVLAVVDDERIMLKGNGHQIYLLDTSFNNYYSGEELINYLRENHFYTEEAGVNVNFLEIVQKDSVGSFRSTINSNSNSNNNNLNSILSGIQSIRLSPLPKSRRANTLRKYRKKYKPSINTLKKRRNTKTFAGKSLRKRNNKKKKKLSKSIQKYLNENN